MGRRWTGDRILGPYYEEGYGWYAILLQGGPRREDGSGGTRSRSLLDCPHDPEGRDAAERQIEAARDELEAPGELTVRQMVDKYATRIEREHGAAYGQFTRAALAPLVDHHADLLASHLTARHAERCLAEHGERKMATRRSYWKALQRFSRYLRERGVCLRDIASDCQVRMGRRDQVLPWRTKKGASEVGRGKAQLRNMTEVYAYTKAALALDHPKRKYRKEVLPRMRLERICAALLLPWTGLRSGELVHLRPCDLDWQAGIGRVGLGDSHADDWEVKGAASVGEFVIPDVVVAHLQALCDLTDADAYLFQTTDGAPRSRWWLRDLVREVCAAAAVDGRPVRVVTPHGLRGTHGTMTMEERKKALAEASKGLRHSDAATGAQTFKRHYQGTAELRPALRLVVGGVAVESEGTDGDK